MPAKVQMCIDSWKNVMPGYELFLWNEFNFDVKSVRFTSEAYSAKKFAFVSDYVRLHALKNYGGIYLDTDVEILKSLDDFLHHGMFLGFEEPFGGVASCIIGSEKNHKLINILLEYYNNIGFIREDGSCHMQPNTIILESFLKKLYGLSPGGQLQTLEDGICIYPSDYFHPMSLISGKLVLTGNSHAIHHHTLLWVSKKTKIIKFIRQWLIVPLIGKEKYALVTARLNNLRKSSAAHYQKDVQEV